eukprot:5464663-Prymnesium_polylepis.1
MPCHAPLLKRNLIRVPMAMHKYDTRGPRTSVDRYSVYSVGMSLARAETQTGPRRERVHRA